MVNRGGVWQSPDGCETRRWSHSKLQATRKLMKVGRYDGSDQPERAESHKLRGRKSSTRRIAKLQLINGLFQSGAHKSS